MYDLDASPPRFLYAACRAEALGDGAPPPTGVGSDDPQDHFVVAFDIDRRTGRLRQINQQPTVGVGPTHCSASGSMLATRQAMPRIMFFFDKQIAQLAERLAVVERWRRGGGRPNCATCVWLGG